MPFLYDPTQDINMMQSGLSVGLQFRQQYGQAQFEHQMTRMQNRDAAFQSFGSYLGTQAGKKGTQMAGGDPNNPTSMGHGYFNTKIGIGMDEAWADKVKAAQDEQNAAAATVSQHTKPSIFTVRERAMKAAGLAEAPGGGIMSTRPPEAPSITGAPAPAAAPASAPAAAPYALPSMVGGAAPVAPAALAGQIQPGARGGAPVGGLAPDSPIMAAITAFQGAIPSGPASQAQAEQNIGTAQSQEQTASALRETAERELESAKASGDPERVAQAKENLVSTIKGQQASRETVGMMDAQRRGDATMLWSNGNASINVVEVNGRAVMTATVGGETFPVDDATIAQITGLTNKNETSITQRMKRQMIVEEYELAKYNQNMQDTMHQGLNELSWENWKGQTNPEVNPQMLRIFGSTEAWQMVVDRMDSLRPMFKNMTPGEFNQRLDDISEIAMLGDPAHSSAANRQEDNTIADTIRENINQDVDMASIKHSAAIEEERKHQELVDANAKARAAANARKQELEDADHEPDSEEVVENKELIATLVSEATELAKSGATLSNDSREALTEMAKSNAEYLARWRSEYGTKSLSSTAGRLDSASPMRKLVEKTLMDLEMFDPVKGEFLLGDEEMSPERVKQLITFFEVNAEKLGWNIDYSEGERQMMEGVWQGHLQAVGANVGAETMVNYDRELDEARSAAQQSAKDASSDELELELEIERMRDPIFFSSQIAPKIRTGNPELGPALDELLAGASIGHADQMKISKLAIGSLVDDGMDYDSAMNLVMGWMEQGAWELPIEDKVRMEAEMIGGMKTREEWEGMSVEERTAFKGRDPMSREGRKRKIQYGVPAELVDEQYRTLGTEAEGIVWFPEHMLTGAAKNYTSVRIIGGGVEPTPEEKKTMKHETDTDAEPTPTPVPTPAPAPAPVEPEDEEPADEVDWQAQRDAEMEQEVQSPTSYQGSDKAVLKQIMQKLEWGPESDFKLQSQYNPDETADLVSEFSSKTEAEKEALLDSVREEEKQKQRDAGYPEKRVDGYTRRYIETTWAMFGEQSFTISGTGRDARKVNSWRTK